MPRRSAAPMALALGLIASACTASDARSAVAPHGDIGENTTMTLPATETTATDEPSQPATHELADLIVDSGWGVDDGGTLRGPAGVMVDLTECPRGWDDQTGLDDGVIELQVHAPRMNELGSQIRPHLDGFAAYLDAVNEQGGVAGRELRIEWVGDSYVAGPSAAERVARSRTPPFAVVTYGSPSTLQGAEALNPECIPIVSPFLGGVSATHDPDRYPWAWGGPLQYEAEVKIWLGAVDQNHGTADPAEITAVVMDNAFGHDVRDTLLALTEDRPGIGSVEIVLHDPTDREPAVDVDTDTDVVVLATAGDACSAIIEQLKPYEGTRLALSVCAPGPLGANTAAPDDGWSRAALTIDALSSQLDPGVLAEADTTLAARSLDPDNPLVRRGYVLDGWLLVEMLRVAAALPGGLSRSNLIVAAWTFATEVDWYRGVELTS